MTIGEIIKSKDKEAYKKLLKMSSNKNKVGENNGK